MVVVTLFSYYVVYFVDYVTFVAFTFAREFVDKLGTVFVTHVDLRCDTRLNVGLHSWFVALRALQLQLHALLRLPRGLHTTV